jgi:hypothetical protein
MSSVWLKTWITVVRTVSWMARHALMLDINWPRPCEVSPLRRIIVGGPD